MNEFDQVITRVRTDSKERLVQKHPKYKYWLPALRFSGIFLGSWTRGKMFEADYLWMRVVDDIVDGDLPLPKSAISAADYIEEKLAFLESPGTSRDDVDILLSYCNNLSKDISLPLVEERKQILLSMLFDAKRKGRYQLFPETVLQEHFYICDIEGTGKGTLKMFGEDPEKYQFVEPLGIASRIYDNLHDYQSDINAGYINISAEDITKYRISPSDIFNINSTGVKSWFATEKDHALRLLEEDKRLFTQGDFKSIGRIFVEFYHRRPTSKFIGNL